VCGPVQLGRRRVCGGGVRVCGVDGGSVFITASDVCVWLTAEDSCPVTTFSRSLHIPSTAGRRHTAVQVHTNPHTTGTKQYHSAQQAANTLLYRYIQLYWHAQLPQYTTDQAPCGRLS